MGKTVKNIMMDKDDFTSEHKRLLKVLKSGKGRKKEYRMQKEEVKERA